jgi:hypothetical protein
MTLFSFPPPSYGAEGVGAPQAIMTHDPLRQRRTLTPPPKTGEGVQR